jgi:hypothetical protein
MATATQGESTSEHRARTSSTGLSRIEIQVPHDDVGLVRQFADGLQGERATYLRNVMTGALKAPPKGSALEMFQSISLPDDLADDLDDILNEPRSNETALDMFQRLQLDETTWAFLDAALKEPHSTELREIEW